MKRILLLTFILTTQWLFSKDNQSEWTGIASFYHHKFEGRKTASGEIFSNQKMTAANNFLPLGTYVKVTNLKNNNAVVVKINDRLHKRNKRLIDLTLAAANKLNFTGNGTCKVKMELSTKDQMTEVAVIKEKQPIKKRKKRSHRRHRR